MQKKKYDKEKWLGHIEEGIKAGPFSDNWDSLSEFNSPKWFSRDKFGIFIHYGLYSVPAFNHEWYSRCMYIKDSPEYKHHVETYGPHKDFGYKDFIPLLTAKRFDAAEWIELFKNAGARYICPVAEHHDGFQMYESSLSVWNSYDMGPHRDFLQELKDEAEKQGVRFCTSSHRAEHWWFMGHGKEFESDIKDPMELGDFYWPAMPEPDNFDMYSKPYPSEEYLDDWLIRTVEIIDKYQPSFLYFDWWIIHEAFKPYLQKLMAYYYNQGVKWGKEVAVCYKHDALSFGTGIVEIERGSFAEAKAYPWQTDTAVARNSWCYTNSLDYKSSFEIIATLIDVVSRNGNLLLNIGPKADGSIPEGDRKILTDLAGWMKINGEAIYGSKPWRKSKEGPTADSDGQFADGKEKVYTSKDMRFTAGHGCIYAFVMKYPEDGNILIRSLGKSENKDEPDFFGIINKVSILGEKDAVGFISDEKGLHISEKVQNRDFPVVIKIETR
ncbi:MAG: alpha-L-fucosidase [Eubacterium sp.]|nr:alpha-L-fucosidase [Eubacterium sp.]